jgi:hypothetical protein
VRREEIFLLPTAAQAAFPFKNPTFSKEQKHEKNDYQADPDHTLPGYMGSNAGPGRWWWRPSAPLLPKGMSDKVKNYFSGERGWVYSGPSS